MCSTDFVLSGKTNSLTKMLLLFSFMVLSDETKKTEFVANKLFNVDEKRSRLYNKIMDSFLYLMEARDVRSTQVLHGDVELAAGVV